jgi:hypothetical protein
LLLRKTTATWTILVVGIVKGFIVQMAVREASVYYVALAQVLLFTNLFFKGLQSLSTQTWLLYGCIHYILSIDDRAIKLLVVVSNFNTIQTLLRAFEK